MEQTEHGSGAPAQKLLHSKPFLLGVGGVVILALYVSYKKQQAAAAAAAAGQSNSTTDANTVFGQIQTLLTQAFQANAQQQTQIAGQIGGALQNIATGEASGLSALASGTSAGLNTLGTGLQTAITPIGQGITDNSSEGFFSIALTSPISCLNTGNVLTQRVTQCIDALHGDDVWLQQGVNYTSGNYASVVTAEQNHYSACKNANGQFDLVCVGKQMMTDRGWQATGSNPTGITR